MAIFLWTEERVKILVDLWLSGKSSTSIGKVFGVSRNSVLGKINRLNLTGRKVNSSLPTVFATPDAKRPKVKPAKSKTAQIIPDLPTKGLISSMLDLKDGLCRFPIGHPLEDDFTFCGASIRPTEVYCQAHKKVCYLPKQQRAAQ